MKHVLLLFLFIAATLPAARAQSPYGLPALQPPDSVPGFPALKDSLEKALQRKDPVAAAGLLSRMGDECYHLGYYPRRSTTTSRRGSFTAKSSNGRPWPKTSTT